MNGVGNGIGKTNGKGYSKEQQQGLKLKKTGASIIGIPQSVTLNFVGNKEINF